MPGRGRQKGIVLLMMVVVVALAISLFYFSSISIERIKIDKINDTRQALKKAKQSLLDYAVLHSGVSGDPGEYGYLPCPDNQITSVEGMQELVCGARHVNVIGYLPWLSLGIAPVKDSSGNCLWYAVSGSYKNNPYSNLINEDTHGMFQVVDDNGNVVQGETPKDQVVAVVLSPGSVLADQDRAAFDAGTLCGGDSANITEYLEGDGVTDNASLSTDPHQIDTFIQRTLNSDAEDVPYNDSLITITREEIWQAVWKSDLEQELAQVTEALALCLAEYINHGSNPNKRLPWPAPLDAGDFRSESNYDDVATASPIYAGRFPFRIDDSNAGLSTAPASDDFLNDASLCTALDLALTVPPASPAITVNMSDEGELHRKLYNNWKDHFFYAISKDYAFPDVAPVGCTSGGDCLSVAGIDYLAVVIYSGSPYNTQARIYDGTLAINDKADISNYLENGNDAVFVAATGSDAYATTNADPLISNDVMFCLTGEASPAVVEC